MAWPTSAVVALAAEVARQHLALGHDALDRGHDRPGRVCVPQVLVSRLSLKMPAASP